MQIQPGELSSLEAKKKINQQLDDIEKRGKMTKQAENPVPFKNKFPGYSVKVDYDPILKKLIWILTKPSGEKIDMTRAMETFEK